MSGTLYLPSTKVMDNSNAFINPAKEDGNLKTLTDFTTLPYFHDIAGKLRVSMPKTVGEYRYLYGKLPVQMDEKGTGTSTHNFSSSTLSSVHMAVTSGQWLVRQSKIYHPYQNGKTQVIQVTFDGFQTEANVVKRRGYFSSSATSPYDSGYDGFWIEDDGTTKRLKVHRSGTEMYNIPMASWTNYAAVSSYDWSKFTICTFDFLWLGGFGLRFFMVLNGIMTLIHEIKHAGNQAGCYMQFPQQPLRTEIRSSTGTGSLNEICSYVATEGSSEHVLRERSVNTGTTAISCATVGTRYLLKAIRKKATQREAFAMYSSAKTFISTADNGLFELWLAPTFSATPTWTDVSESSVQEATGNGTITITGGYLLTSFVSGQDMMNDQSNQSMFNSLGIDLDNVSVPLVLACAPMTANISAFGIIDYAEIL